MTPEQIMWGLVIIGLLVILAGRRKPRTEVVDFAMSPSARRAAENFVVGHWPETPYGLSDQELRELVEANHPDGWEGFWRDRGLRL